MSKPIYLDEATVDDFLNRIRAKLLSQKTYGKVELDESAITMGKQKVNVLFTPTAWCKVKELVEKYSTEVQWSGTVERIDEGFLVKDILVFPHEVTGVTVTSDQETFEKALDALPDDVFNSLRFHGHSHVNMDVTPSSVDMEFRHNLVGTMSRDGVNRFFVFLIFNKKGSISGEVYDIENNILYDRNEVEVDVLFEDGTLESFIADAKTKTTEPTPATRGAKGGKGSKKGLWEASPLRADPYVSVDPYTGRSSWYVDSDWE